MNSGMAGIWEELGIAPTTDKRKIKKAYAEAVKRCHPEEHPEAFQQLYAAYQMALEGCSSGTTGMPVIIPTFLTEPRHEGKQEKISRGNERSKAEIPEADDAGTEDTESVKFQELFDRNNRRKQEICDRYILLWKGCLEKPNAQATADLIGFLRGGEFLIIKDYSDALVITAYLIAQNPGGLSGEVIELLWEIYDFEHHGICQGVEQDDPAYIELYETLGKERDQYLQQEERKKQKAERKKSILSAFVVLLFAFLLLIVGTLIEIWIEISPYDNRIAERIRVMGIMEEKYPDFSFIDWSYPPETNEKSYQLSARAFLKRGNDRTYVKVVIEDNWKGEIVSFQDDFEEESIKMLAGMYGLHCSGITAEHPEKRYIIIDYTSDCDLSAYADGIDALARTGTVRSLGISGIGVCHAKGTILWEMEELSELDPDAIAEEIQRAYKDDTVGLCVPFDHLPFFR